MNKRFFLIPLVVLGILIFSIKTFKIDNKKIDTKGYIFIAQGSKPKSLDPHKFNDFSVLAVTEHIFNTLVSVNDKGEIIPELAEKWEYITPKEIVFTLRKGVKFHNGEILKASDVVFSLNRMIGEPASYPLVKDIESINELDNYRVKVTLKQVSAPFLANLIMPLTAILNEKAYKEKTDEIAIAPIGTGPFKVKSWGEGEKIVLEVHKDYFKGKPKNNGIVFKTIMESSGRVAALETGDVDIVYGISPMDYKYITENPKLQLIDLLSMSTDYLVINTEKKYLNNPKVREAINLAIDKRGIIEAIYLGKGRIAESVVSPAIFGSYQGLKQIELNIEKSKKILQDIGIKNEEIKLKLWTSENPARVQIAQIIQSDLKKIGIDMEIEIVELGGLLTRSGNGEHDLLLTTWITGVSDADTILTSLFHSSSVGKAGNRSFYKSNEVENLLDNARTTIIKEERLELYKKAQEEIAKDKPVIPLVYRMDGIGISKKIKGFDYNKSSMRKYYELMEKDER